MSKELARLVSLNLRSLLGVVLVVSGVVGSLEVGVTADAEIVLVDVVFLLGEVVIVLGVDVVVVLERVQVVGIALIARIRVVSVGVVVAIVVVVVVVVVVTIVVVIISVIVGGREDVVVPVFPGVG